MPKKNRYLILKIGVKGSREWEWADKTSIVRHIREAEEKHYVIKIMQIWEKDLIASTLTHRYSPEVKEMLKQANFIYE